MLVQFRKDYKKIVMGLLSFIPDLKDYQRLEAEVDWSQSDDRPIYLWKSEELDQFTGVGILEIGYKYVLVRRLSFSPSGRGRKAIFDFLSAIQERYPDRRVMGTMDNQPMITSWRINYLYEQTVEQNQRRKEERNERTESKSAK